MTSPNGPWVGRPMPRREDHRLLTGCGEFIADITRGCAQACFVRSPHAHAHIVGIDTGRAAALAGVLAVLTAEDLGLIGASLPMLHQPHPAFAEATQFTMADARLAILAHERVHYVGRAGCCS